MKIFKFLYCLLFNHYALIIPNEQGIKIGKCLRCNKKLIIISKKKNIYQGYSMEKENDKENKT